jgi:hypothetical protein
MYRDQKDHVKISKNPEFEKNLRKNLVQYEFLNFEILQRNVCWWATFFPCN